MALVSSLATVALFGFLSWGIIKLLSVLMEKIAWNKRFKKFPQDPAHLIFGHLLDFPGPNDAGLAYQREKTAIYPRLCLTWMFQSPVVITNHADNLKIVLKSSGPKAKGTYNLLTPWIGDGLLKSSGKKWLKHRRLLTPAFHFDILKIYLNLKNQAVDKLLGKFAKAAETKQTLEVYTHVSLFTLDVILRSSMSYETDCQDLGEKHPYVLAVNEITNSIVDRFLKPWLHPDFIYFMTPSCRKFLRNCKYVHEIADSVIKNRRSKLQSEGDKRNTENQRNGKTQDFLDILLTAKDENGNGLGDREIRDEVDTFLFEGHDTTASSLSWALYSIAGHPSIQAKIQEEVDEKLAGRENDELLWEDLSSLPYLTMVIKESMRFHCPVPFIQRQLTNDTEIDGHLIPADTVVSIIIYNVHHNPAMWKDSMKFDPDRFLPEEVEKRDPYAFIPFSAGPRNCIGQNFAMDEIKVALARILYRFNLCLDPTHKVTKCESLVMKPDNGIHIFVTARTPQAGKTSQSK